MLERLRPYAQGLINALAKPLSKIPPSILTILSLPLAVAFTYFVWTGHVGKAILALVLGALLDALDGAVARLSGKASSAGALLDSSIDRLVDVIVFFSLPALGVPWSVTYLWITGSLIVSLIRALAEAEGVELRGKGLMERGDRLLALLILLLLFLAEKKVYPLKEVRYVPALATGITALIWLTVLQRLYYTSSTKAFWAGINSIAVAWVLLYYGWYDPFGIAGVAGGLACAYVAARGLSLGLTFPVNRVDAILDALTLLSFIFFRGVPSWSFYFIRLAMYYKALKTRSSKRT